MYLGEAFCHLWKRIKKDKAKIAILIRNSLVTVQKINV